MMATERPGMGDEKRALRCQQARVMLMGYLDGELSSQHVRQIEDHLAVCVDCRSEERAYRRLGKVTEEMIEARRPSANADVAWAGIYWRIERRIGWLVASAGLTVLTLFGLWRLINGFLLDPSAPLALRVGTGGLLVGGVILLVSFVRERLFHRRTERYREVQR